MAFSFGDFWARAITFVLPAATIALLLMPHIARVARVATSEAFAASYVGAARLRGLNERQVKWDHAFRNAAVPLVSVIGLNLVYAISGVLVVDYLFGFPGIGSLLVAAIGSGDVLTTQGIIMMFAVIITLINISVDIVILWLNPRLRLAATMTDGPMSAIALEEARVVRRRPAWLVMLSSRDGRFGFSLIVAMLALIILGPLLAPYAPTEIRLAPANQGPSVKHWLGTDHLGRDVLSRFLWGGRSIISIPIIAITITY